VWGKIYPPTDWGCRCYVDAIPADEFDGDFEEQRTRVKEYFSTPEWKRSVAQGWGVNRADTAEVFSANQMYIKKFPTKAAKLVGGLHYNDYGLDSFGKMCAEATSEFNPYKGTAKEWFSANKQLEDFSGKRIDMPKDVFDTHTGGKYEKVRVPLLGSISDVLKNPDEVWMNDYKNEFKNLNYIKFYKGKVVNVICEPKDGGIQINTWFDIHPTPTIRENGKQSRKIDPRWRYRRGLLVKK
jgi:hypothetical protein